MDPCQRRVTQLSTASPPPPGQDTPHHHTHHHHTHHHHHHHPCISLASSFCLARSLPCWLCFGDGISAVLFSSHHRPTLAFIITTEPPPCHFQGGAGWCGFFLMLFTYSKFFELLDTIFLVLRKVKNK